MQSDCSHWWQLREKDTVGTILKYRGVYLFIIDMKHRNCLESLWSLHPLRYSKPDWTRPSATSSSWYCFEQRGGLHNPQRPFLNTVILWVLNKRLVSVVEARKSKKMQMSCQDQEYSIHDLSLLQASAAELTWWTCAWLGEKNPAQQYFPIWDKRKS